MKKWLLIGSLILSNAAFAQRAEIGLHAGVSNYFGDLAPSVRFNESHPAAGLYARLNLNHTWAMRLEFNRFRVSGNDANFSFNKVRNLSFQTDINEVAYIFEFNYLKYGPHVLHENFTSYVYLGLAGFSFDPKAYMDGTWFTLSDYKTENVAYKKLSVAVPFGIGIKYMPNKRFAIEAQLGFRKTFTDYIDDVSTVYPDINARFADGGLITAKLTDRSIEHFGTPQFKDGYQRGDPGHKDWYTSFTLGCSFRLHTKVKCARFF